MVGRRSDGYHTLESLFWPIDLVDDLYVRAHSAPKVEMQWAADAPYPQNLLPGESENLVYRLLKKVEGQNYSVRIEKRIPIGGGLGGGSSNVGALLSFLDLPAWAPELGADVPYFLDPSPSWVTGVGENCSRVSFVHAPTFVLLMLPESTSTKLVFEKYAQQTPKFSPETAGPDTSLKDYLSASRNDLEPFAVAVTPLIAKALDALRHFPSLYAGMTGSGSSCVAAFDTAAEADKCVKGLFPFCREYSCRSIKAKSYSGERHGNYRSKSIPSERGQT